MKYIRVIVHTIIECILHPFQNAELCFDEDGNLVGRNKY
jgi:hypothetical protein